MIDNTEFKRLRWTKIDIAVSRPVDYDSCTSSCASSSNVSSSSTTFTTLTSAYSQNTIPDYMLRVNCEHKTYVALVKRLMKPMYPNVINLFARTLPVISTDGSPVVDQHIYVDMVDHTLWIEFEQPMPIEDFYKNVVSNQLNNEKYDGYEIDKEPSNCFIRLSELKQTFVSWWCN